MPKILFAFVMLCAVFVSSCTQSYKVGLVFAKGGQSSPAVLGKTEIVDALKRMRKTAKAANDVRVPKWVLRKVPSSLCMPSANEVVSLKKKVKSILRRLSSRISVVLDYTCENALDVLAPLYAEYNLIVVSPYGRNLRMQEPHKAMHVFSTGIGLDTKMHATVHFLHERGAKHIVIVDDGLRYSRNSSNLLASVIDDFDISFAVVSGRMLPNGRGVIEAINALLTYKNLHRESFQHDAIVYVGAHPEIFVKTARDAGLVHPIVLPNLFFIDNFRADLGTYTDEVYVLGNEFFTNKTSSYPFYSWFESHYARLSPTRVVTEAYVAIEVALNLARRAEDTQKNTGIDLPLGKPRISTLFGNVYFDEKNAIRDVHHMYVIKNNLFVRYNK